MGTLSETPRCDTCAHWKRDRSDWSRPVGFAYDPDFKFEGERDPGDDWMDDEDYHDTIVSRQFGRCSRIVMVDDAERGSELPLATVTDGSNYVANLNTQAEFGCVLHELTTATAALAAFVDEVAR